jgi:hypothetical protein
VACYLRQGALKRDGGGFKVFYVLPDAERFTNDSKIDFCSVIGRDGGCWIRLAVEIPGC